MEAMDVDGAPAKQGLDATDVIRKSPRSFSRAINADRRRRILAPAIRAGSNRIAHLACAISSTITW